LVITSESDCDQYQIIDISIEICNADNICQLAESEVSGSAWSFCS